MSKTLLITGTSSGFGRILTEKLLERGDRVAATVRRADALDDLRGRYGDRSPGDTLDTQHHDIDAPRGWHEDTETR